MSKDENIKKERNNKKVGESVTQYGEFISSYFAWLSPSKQKERAKKLQDITKK
jgi:hypothetical protein